MGYSVEAINNEESGVKKRKALQEQILSMNKLQDGKTRRDGAKVEEPEAITHVESKGDSVDISTQGQRALEQMESKKTKTDERKTSDTKDKASASDNVDKESLELNAMSRGKLNTLVAEGVITRAEMKKELKRRSDLSFPPETADEV